MTTSATPPPVGPNLGLWAEAVRRYLERWLPRLQWKTQDANPSENGVILWDETQGRPVVSYDNEFVPLAYERDMGSLDAFGRLRISEPYTLFDSKQIIDNQPLYFDDQEVSGSGTSSTHSVDRASSVMGVSASTAGKRVRQTFQRFNYQEGKSQLIMCTGILMASGGGSGIITRMGYFDDDNGVFVSEDSTGVSFTIRSNVTGSPVDTTVAQADWNGDKMDGTGLSGITLDTSKTQIYWSDMEWLGVGAVRCGFVVAGEFITCHTFKHANIEDSVYTSAPNNPIRYEIENTGAGAASTMEHICSTVISEGGRKPYGCIHYDSTAGTPLAASTSGTLYACIGIRLKSSALQQNVDLINISVMNTSSQDFEWLIAFNPTVSGTFTYSDLGFSSLQTAKGVTANTVTGAPYIFEGGFVKSGASSGDVSGALQNAIRLGSAIDGTPDEIVLCVRPLANNATIEAGMTWQEIV